MEALRSRRCGYLRQGLSLTELLCVTAILVSLLALLLPGIQNVRESARTLRCANNIRTLGLAALAYESSLQELPPGNLGFADSLVYDWEFVNRWSEDPGFEFFWKKAQHSSSLALLLPYYEQQSLYDSLPAAFSSRQLYGQLSDLPHSWIGEWSNVDSAMKTRINVLLCSSDDLGNGIPADAIAYVGAQPVFLIDRGGNGLDGFMAKDLLQRTGLQSTNYIGCAGAYSGGPVPIRDMNRFTGALSCRESVALASIKDGNSQTMLFGETVGQLSEGRRRGAFIWTFGSLGRGRGGLPWGKIRQPGLPEAVLLGDWVYSDVAGFGSKHPMTVNTAFVDGTTHGVGRGVNLKVWYALCGIRDGIQVDSGQF